MEKETRQFAIRVLVRRRSQVVAYIWSIVRDAHLADDLFQDVAVIASEKAPAINDEARLLKWILKTARYEALNAVRKKGREKIVFSDDVLDLLDRDWCNAPQRNKVGISEALEHCLGRLGGTARNLIDLRYGQGVRGIDLAKIIGRTANATYLALSRIHRQLRRCVENEIRREEGLSDG